MNWLIRCIEARKVRRAVARHLARENAIEVAWMGYRTRLTSPSLGDRAAFKDAIREQLA